MMAGAWLASTAFQLRAPSTCGRPVLTSFEEFSQWA